MGVSAKEFIRRVKLAANENNDSTAYINPKWTREELRQRRDLENTFRLTELGIPQGTEVVVIGTPSRVYGTNTNIRLKLVAPGDPTIKANPVQARKSLKGKGAAGKILPSK